MYPELNDEHYHLIIRQLDGYASPEEVQQLQRWLDENPANVQAFDSIKAFWTGAEKASVFEKIEVDGGWALFQSETQKVIKPKQSQ